jgi:hypothetical protein
MRRNTLFWLLGATALATGTPAVVGLMHSAARFYLLQAYIFVVQAFPYLVAAALWLPWRAPDPARIVHTLARALFYAAAVFYAAMLTGIFPIGGDMIGLGVILVALTTLALIVSATIVAFAMLWVRRRRDRTPV